MNILLVLISYPAVALLLWWALGEFGDTPEGKILARWKRAALLRAQATGNVLPLIVPLLPVTSLASSRGQFCCDQVKFCPIPLDASALPSVEDSR